MGSSTWFLVHNISPRYINLTARGQLIDNIGIGGFPVQQYKIANGKIFNGMWTYNPWTILQSHSGVY